MPTKRSRSHAWTSSRHRLERLEERQLLALTAELGIDVNTFSYGSSHGDLVRIGDLAYFPTGYSDRKVWKTDGTDAGTEVIEEYAVGEIDTGLSLEKVGATLLLFGGDKIWSSDGTNQGAVKIMEGVYGSYGGLGGRTVEVNGELYFIGVPRKHSYDQTLWRTDGTELGTAPVPTGGTRPRPLAAMGDRLLFSQNTPEFGQELWITDGTAGGTILLADTLPGPESGLDYWHNDVIALDGNILFGGGGMGSQLWSTDGTVEGTRQVADIDPDGLESQPRLAAIVNGAAIFTAYEVESGTSLWRSDGTQQGTTKIAHLDPYEVGIVSPATVGDRLLFGMGSKLWSTDGTPDGTAVFAERPNANAANSWGGLLFPAGGFAYFGGTSLALGTELWKTDGTSAGTTLVTVILPSRTSSTISLAVELQNHLVFLAYERLLLMVSDGTREGTQYLGERSPGNGGTWPLGFAAADSLLYFLAANDDVWATDGTQAGSRRVWRPTELREAPYYAPGLLTAGDGLFFVSQTDPWDGTPRRHRLWGTDGTAGNAQLLAETIAGQGLREFQVVGQRLYFEGPDGELWISDGTKETTRRIKAFAGYEAQKLAPADFVELNGWVYFSGLGVDLKRRLWRTDGTEEGTQLLLDPASTDALNPQELVRVGDRLYFAALATARGSLLWTTDGTITETRLAVDNLPGLRSLDPTELVAIGDRLYFVTHNSGLWVSHGTPETAVRLASGSMSRFAAADGQLFFRVTISNQESAWWRTDGTPEGTIQLTPIARWRGEIAVVNGKAFFILSGSQGVEFWTSDGTLDGTFSIATNGCGLEVPLDWSIAAGFRGDVYYCGQDSLHGYEPWRIVAPPGDANLDGEVNLYDLNAVRNNFGYQGQSRSGDANGDGIVGIDDLNEVRNHFGLPLPSQTPHRVHVPYGDARQNIKTLRASAVDVMMHQFVEGYERHDTPLISKRMPWQSLWRHNH